MTNKEELTTPEKTVEDSAEIAELKHSIRIHLLIMAGPSQQLCAFLVKVIDLVEDTDIKRRKAETLQLSFCIIEAIAVHTQKAIDARYEVSKKKSATMPESVRIYSDEIMIMVGKARSFDDKVAAKNSVLQIIAKAFDALGTFSKCTYPTLFDSSGTKLNNHDKGPGDKAVSLDK